MSLKSRKLIFKQKLELWAKIVGISNQYIFAYLQQFTTIFEPGNLQNNIDLRGILTFQSNCVEGEKEKAIWG